MKIQNLQTRNNLYFDTGYLLWWKVMVKIKKIKRDHAEFYHDFNAGKTNTFNTILLKSFNSAILVFSCHNFNLSTNKCKLSLIKYKFSYSVLFQKHVKDYGPRWNHTEFYGGNIPLLLQQHQNQKDLTLLQCFRNIF